MAVAMMNAARKGRPTISTTERRSELVKFRATPEEDAAITGRAAEANLTVSEYCRAAALGLPIIVHRDATPMEVIAQLRRIGNNLNQVLREARFNNFPPPVADECEATLRELSAYLRKLLYAP